MLQPNSDSLLLRLALLFCGRQPLRVEACLAYSRSMEIPSRAAAEAEGDPLRLLVVWYLCRGRRWPVAGRRSVPSGHPGLRK